jgi:hypothetical protein
MTMDLRLTYVQNNLPALHTLAIIDALHEPTLVSYLVLSPQRGFVHN